VLSTSFLLAARDGTTHKKFSIPQIDLKHSDDPIRAQQRADLANQTKELIQIEKSYSYQTIAPLEDEF
jgi:hypothetical protein